jgi:soluble lytic murein transglycosylase-like protein
MFNTIFDAQLQTSMYKAMWQMFQTMMTQMEQMDKLSTTTGANSSTSGTSFADALTKAAQPAAVKSAAKTAASAASFSQPNASIEELIQGAASKYGVDPLLIRSVIRAESNFNPKAVSSCGAAGLMQLMPGTARGLGVTNSFDPAQNVDGGVRFLKGLLNRYNGKVELALAAYNAGPGAVDKYGGIPPYTETQTYVRRITGMMRAEGWQG